MTFRSAYLFPAFLIASIILGGFSGYLLNDNVLYLKPFGDILIHLIFTTIVPLIFFSVTSAIAQLGSVSKLKHILSSMTLVFLFTSSIAALYALLVVSIAPPDFGVSMSLAAHKPVTPLPIGEQLVSAFTVSDFSQLFSHTHILALILFSILLGVATASLKDKGEGFALFLKSGEAVFLKLFSIIMYYAPIGFFAYFAVMVHDIGPKLFGSYLRIGVTYYLCALLYFIVFLSAYAYLAGRLQGLRLFWSNILLPAVTSLATCSSAASIPANLIATRQMGVSDDICNTAIPLGSMIHKDGSVLGGVFKIAFLFGLFHMDFSGFSVLLLAFGISLLVGTVMGAIPGGGMLGELLILNLYGFPPSVLIAVAAISIIIDPIATLINVTGNSVSGMLIARVAHGKRWYVKSGEEEENQGIAMMTTP